MTVISARTELLVVIPAALHGHGLPRRALRPLNNRPLLLHTIGIAKGVVADTRQIVVFTDDDEIALRAEREGCVAVLSHDASAWETGDDPAIFELITARERSRGERFESVALLKTTSPLVRPEDLQLALRRLDSGAFDTIVSARQEPEPLVEASGGGSDAGGGAVVALYRETNAFVISRRHAITSGRFRGPCVGTSLVPAERAIDITSPHEWWICERLLRRKRVVFVVAGNRRVGMGHIYRALQLAHEINNHEVMFVCTRDSDLASRTFSANQYRTAMQGEESLAESVLAHQPDLVINDFLETTSEYVHALQAAGAKVINFEDLGGGAEVADLVVNALFMEAQPKPNHRVGPDFFCIRDEFLDIAPQPFRPAVEEVLITFGGVDPPDLTSRVLRVIHREAARRRIHLTIVTGPGYAHLDALKGILDTIDTALVTQSNGTKRISEYMAKADLAFSSAGRTTFELATMRVPTIVVASNAGEETHPFAYSHSGFAYLGRQDRVTDAGMLAMFCDLADDPAKRQGMHEFLKRFDFRDGKKRVLDEIARVLTTPLS